jgi:hypothetical protein
VNKKWYSFFVVTDDPAGTPEHPAASGSSPAAAAPRRAIDVVSDAETLPVVPESASVSADLGLVYSAAQIGQPSHGYTVLKVAEMLQSEHIRTLPADVKRKSIMVALEAAGVKVSEIIEDAVRRDRALDTYERVLDQHLEELRGRLDQENAQIDQEIQQRLAELRARVDANRQKLDAEVRELQAWRERKQQEETTIADAVSYFVSENPITAPAGTARERAKGDTDVR